MDLSFSRFEHDAPLIVLPPDLAVLMVGVAARQAASPTAILNARLWSLPVTRSLFAPVHGAFNAGVAKALMAWKQV